MDDYCRLCAKDNSEKIDLFLHIDSDLCDLIEKLVNLKVREDDVDMPKMICDDCHDQLVTFNDYLSKCEEGQNILNSLRPNSSSNKKSGPYTVLHVDIRRTDEVDEDGGKNDIKTEENQPVYTDYEELTESDILLDDSLSDDDNTLEQYDNEESVVDSVVDSVFDSGMASNEEYCEQKLNGDLDPAQYHRIAKEIISPSPTKKRTISENSRQLKCTICSALVMEPSQYDNHYVAEQTTTVFKCRNCPLQFENNRSYSRHMLLHMEGPKFECPYCYKKFGQKETLKNHMTIHEKSKSFICSSCDKKFKPKTSLTHAYMVTKDTKVKCNICRISFSSAETLKSHMKSYHTSLKEEECNICGKSLPTKAALYFHLKQHKVRGTVT